MAAVGSIDATASVAYDQLYRSSTALYFNPETRTADRTDILFSVFVDFQYTFRLN